MFSLCQVGIGLLTASVVVSVLSTQGKKRFAASLTPEQLSVYRDIGRTRLMIYVVSLGIGGALGWLYVQGTGGDVGWSSACTGAGVATVASYFVYKMWPKKQWMLNHLTGNPASGVDAYTQTQLWLEMYKTACWNFHAGFLVGVVGYAVFLKGTCRPAPKASAST